MRGGSEESHPTNEVGDPEGKKAPGEAGDKSTEGKKGKRARFRQRVSLRRAGNSKPKLSTSKLSKPKVPKGADDLRFRAVTRLRAIGYWIQEKAQIAWRWLRRAGAALSQWWSKRSRSSIAPTWDR